MLTVAALSLTGMLVIRLAGLDASYLSYMAYLLFYYCVV